MHKVGDTVWIWLLNHKGNMTKGTIVKEVELEDGLNFIIQIPAPPVGVWHEVRGDSILEIHTKDNSYNKAG